MRPGFSSRVTENLFDYVVGFDLTGSQLCELANRIADHGKQKLSKQ